MEPERENLHCAHFSLLRVPFRIDLRYDDLSIVRRLNPANFIPRPKVPQSDKFRLGLHTLSASLLNPDKYVLKNDEGTVLIVLMPLPEDVKLFYKLRELAKTGGCESFKSAMVVMASEFTRPQLASRLDMGAIYVMGTSTTKQSVKYVRGSGTGVTTSDTHAQCRTNARENYRDILTGLDQSNEVTLNYRKCGFQSKFPVFGVTAKDSSDYVEIALNVPIDQPPPNSDPPRRGLIPTIRRRDS